MATGRAFRLLASPLASSFQSLWEGLETSCLICSPFISVAPVRQLVKTIEGKHLQDSLAVTIVTDLAIDNLVRGASDVAALLFVAERVRNGHHQLCQLHRWRPSRQS
jgi:hypothetical protein